MVPLGESGRMTGSITLFHWQGQLHNSSTQQWQQSLFQLITQDPKDLENLLSHSPHGDHQWNYQPSGGPSGQVPGQLGSAPLPGLHQEGPVCKLVVNGVYSITYSYSSLEKWGTYRHTVTWAWRVRKRHQLATFVPAEQTQIMLVSPGKDLNKQPAGYLSLSVNYDNTKSNSSATRRETVARTLPTTKDTGLLQFWKCIKIVWLQLFDSS